MPNNAMRQWGCSKLHGGAGKRLAAFRKTLGLSQRAFASSVGVSGGFIGQLEADLLPPSRSFLEKILGRYRVSADWLLYGRGEMLLAEASPQVDVSTMELPDFRLEAWPVEGNDGPFQISRRSPSDEPVKAPARTARLTGRGFVGRHKARIDPPELTHPTHGDFRFNGIDYVMIRRMELSATARNGLAPPAESEVAEALAFSAASLSRDGINADLAVLVRLNDASMAPTIPEGALILLHLAEMTVIEEGIYAFTREGIPFIRRLVPSKTKSKRQQSSIAILGDSPDCRPDVVTGEGISELRILGRVRRVMSRA